jgi:hypothetical protein
MAFEGQEGNSPPALQSRQSWSPAGTRRPRPKSSDDTTASGRRFQLRQVRLLEENT